MITIFLNISELLTEKSILTSTVPHRLLRKRFFFSSPESSLRESPVSVKKKVFINVMYRTSGDCHNRLEVNDSWLLIICTQDYYNSISSYLYSYL